MTRFLIMTMNLVIWEESRVHFFEYGGKRTQAFFRNNAVLGVIKSFSLPRVHIVHASLEEDALAWKIANYVFYFSENHLLLLKKKALACVVLNFTMVTLE